MLDGLCTWFVFVFVFLCCVCLVVIFFLIFFFLLFFRARGEGRMLELQAMCDHG